MERKRRLRTTPVLLGWLSVGLLLSAATCETPQEKSDREFRHQINMQNQLQMQMHWNAEQEKKLKEEAARQAILQRGELVSLPSPFDYRSGRNSQEQVRVVLQPDKL